MFAPLRVAIGILLLGLGMATAFATGSAYEEILFGLEVPVIEAGGVSIDVLTGSPVGR